MKCTGIILSKLDGTAKGGAIFAIKQKLGLPVKFVGVGEQTRRHGTVRPRRVRQCAIREGVKARGHMVKSQVSQCAPGLL